MLTSLKRTQLGTFTGAVLPKEVLARMKGANGDTLYAIKDQLNAGREIMKEYRETFKSLAK